jgi:FlaA1/EpsC-like NDP-sugar epimerase
MGDKLSLHHDGYDLCDNAPELVQSAASTAAAVLGISDVKPIYGPEARQLIERQPVLVTGAGGSIGAEIVRQLSYLGADPVICADQDEYGLYRLQLELTGQALLTDTSMVLVDVTNRAQIEQMMREHRPALVFHAAARKHLPLLERSPAQAIITNVIGTANVTAAAARSRVQRLVNISTDKAADPVSVLGQTKQLAEAAVLQNAGPVMRAASVRFGNVYGSRGSFIETLDYQIRHGMPVTVTDPGMTRFFMTIPQAAGLVIQAAVLADSASTFILDMGEPYLITDLISRYATAVGSRVPEIICTGQRPGEKLDEQLVSRAETPQRTRHPQIFAIRGARDDATAVGIKTLCAAANRGDSPAALRAALTELTSRISLPIPVRA